MSLSGIVTLLTDFGLSDVYVGVIKAVIAQINPELRVIDLTHNIPPQNIAAGRFCLMNAVPYFPPKTVHIAVVDPGVGSQRRAIAVDLPTGYLIGPDNGVLGGAMGAMLAQCQTPDEFNVIELSNPDYWRTPIPSTTFHGRDIFAAAGAYLASGVPFRELGHPVDPATLTDVILSESSFTEEGIEGCIQHIDHFGNLITNIPGHFIEEKTWFVAIGGLEDTEESEELVLGNLDKNKEKKKKKKGKGNKDKDKVSKKTASEIESLSGVSRIIPGGITYADVQPGNLVALVGSHGWVEIAANQGNAQSILQLQWGSRVHILLTDS
ncbi:S-adenosyl-l-methionine hydroxide adenosyltransferase family protein [Capilliphycus salinus ALCB114379]|uniref:SAM hydrolase/SAM-dependent halogenase family protein n=1 Tax=Capilliphycus salinus TaxID=2768948 RepID=UPI0039A6ED8D